MSKSKEQLYFCIFAFFVVAFLFIAPYFLIPQINSARSDWINNAPKNACFLELWQIDTFEGGSASRARFLEKMAFSYQEKTSSVYVLVRSVELEQAKMLLQNGASPDMISFGMGAGDFIEGMAKPMDLPQNVRVDIASGGRKEGVHLAVPWCMGGYVLCNRQDIDFSDLDSFSESTELDVFGTGFAYNLPFRALNEGQSQFLSKTKYSQYEAYEAFLKGNEFEVLLGTQRDFFRLNNKVKLGVEPSIKYTYLSGYTDLVQYVAITTKNDAFVSVANDFVNYLTSDSVQKKLTSIGMFGVTEDTIYDDEYKDFELALKNKLQVMNVFVSNVWIKEEQDKC